MTSSIHRFEQHITVDTDNQTAVDIIADATDLSRQAIKQAMSKGAVWVSQGNNTRRLRRATKTLAKGTEIHLYYDESVLSSCPPDPVLICDKMSYSVWYKPYGMLSQGTKWGDHCTITRWAEKHLQPQRPAFVVHRLDRAATGLILVAHGKRTTAALSQLFQQRQIEKTYHAIVHGKFSGTLSVNSKIDGRHACSHIALIEYCKEKNRSLVSVDIETGRKHQIRKHLSTSGFAIVGDRLYGKDIDGEDLMLCAQSLAFICPTSHKQVCYQTPEAKCLRL